MINNDQRLFDSRENCVFEFGAGNRPVFHSLGLQQSLEAGIVIPTNARGLFSGRSVVHIEDPDFAAAMKLHVRSVLSKSGYHWGSQVPQKG